MQAGQPLQCKPNWIVTILIVSVFVLLALARGEWSSAEGMGSTVPRETPTRPTSPTPSPTVTLRPSPTVEATATPQQPETSPTAQWQPGTPLPEQPTQTRSATGVTTSLPSPITPPATTAVGLATVSATAITTPAAARTASAVALQTVSPGVTAPAQATAANGCGTGQMTLPTRRPLSAIIAQGILQPNGALGLVSLDGRTTAQFDGTGVGGPMCVYLASLAAGDLPPLPAGYALRGQPLLIGVDEQEGTLYTFGQPFALSMGYTAADSAGLGEGLFSIGMVAEGSDKWALLQTERNEALRTLTAHARWTGVYAVLIREAEREAASSPSGVDTTVIALAVGALAASGAVVLAVWAVLRRRQRQGAS